MENKLFTFIQQIPVHLEEHNRSDLSFYSSGDSTEISVTFHLTINFFSKMSETLLRREKNVIFVFFFLSTSTKILIYIYISSRDDEE